MSADTTTGAIERTVTVGSRVGLHARPAAAVVKLAGTQPAVVRIAREGGTPADCRSLLSILALGAVHGDAVVLTAEGEGAAASVDALAELIASDMDAEQ